MSSLNKIVSYNSNNLINANNDYLNNLIDNQNGELSYKLVNNMIKLDSYMEVYPHSIIDDDNYCLNRFAVKHKYSWPNLRLKYKRAEQERLLNGEAQNVQNIKNSRSTLAQTIAPATQITIQKVRSNTSTQTILTDNDLEEKNKGIEALSVLISHLVFNYEAFKTPILKRDLEKMKKNYFDTKLSLDEMAMGYHQLETLLKNEKSKAEQLMEIERNKNRNEIDQVINKYQSEVNEMAKIMESEKRKYIDESELDKLKYETDLAKLTKVNEELNKNFEKININYEMLENDYKKLKASENEYKNKYEEKIKAIETLKQEFEKKEKEFLEKIQQIEKHIIQPSVHQDSNCSTKETNKKSENKNVKEFKLQAALDRCTQLQNETESLRCVLELKSTELTDLRKNYEKSRQDAEQLPMALSKIHVLQSRVEDLEIQLDRKDQNERKLIKENQLLFSSLKQGVDQNKTLSFQIEELKYKLKQNTEAYNLIMNGHMNQTKQNSSPNSNLDANPSPINSTLSTPTNSKINGTKFVGRTSPFLRHCLKSSSFSEKHNGYKSSAMATSSPIIQQISQTAPKVNVTFSNPNSKSLEMFETNDLSNSPPNSPKVKGLIAKSDSVSYVLEIDESTEMLANRIYRRSFRSNKTLNSIKSMKKKNPLSLSASETYINGDETKLNKSKMPQNRRIRSKSVSNSAINSMDSIIKCSESLTNSSPTSTNNSDSYYSSNTNYSHTNPIDDSDNQTMEIQLNQSINKTELIDLNETSTNRYKQATSNFNDFLTQDETTITIIKDNSDDFFESFTDLNSLREKSDREKNLSIHRVKLDPMEVTFENTLNDEIIIEDKNNYDDIDDFNDDFQNLINNCDTLIEFNSDMDFLLSSEHSIQLPALPSELNQSEIGMNKSVMNATTNRGSNSNLLDVFTLPKNSAGEAMISESNSDEDDSVSSASVSSSNSV